MKTATNVLLRVCLLILLSRYSHQKLTENVSHGYDGRSIYSVSRPVSLNFDLKVVDSIELYESHIPKTTKTGQARNRNISEMSNAFCANACKEALHQKYCQRNEFVYMSSKGGDSALYLIDDKDFVIAYQCPTKPPIYLKGNVNLDTNRSQILILVENSNSGNRYVSSAASSSSPSPALSRLGSRYLSSATAPLSSPSSRPAYRKVSPATPPSSYPYSRSASIPRYGTSQGTKPMTPPPQRKDPQLAKRSFHLGQFLYRLVGPDP